MKYRQNLLWALLITISAFGGNEDFKCDIENARIVFDQGKNDLARQVCLCVLDSSQNENSLIKAHTLLAQLDISTGQLKKATDRLRFLSANYGNDPNLPSCLFNISNEFEKAGFKSEAKGLYIQISEKFPKSK